jgi:hypothetical protein
MPRKPAPKADNSAQHKRFIDMAREVEVDEREGALDRAFERIADKARVPKASVESASSSSRRSSKKAKKARS